MFTALIGIFLDVKLNSDALCQTRTCNIGTDQWGEQARTGKQNPLFQKCLFFILSPFISPPFHLKDGSTLELQCLVKKSRYDKICPRWD